MKYTKSSISATKQRKRLNIKQGDGNLPTKESKMEQAHKQWLKEKQALIDEMATAISDLAGYNRVLENRRIDEILHTLYDAKEFIKKGEI